MKPAGKNVLGLALESGAIVACQLQLDGKAAPRLVRVATFALPQGATLDKPEALAEPFAAFLREKRITAKRAVVGLPANWLAVKERTVPPTDDAATIEMLRLVAEREFATDARELIVDCALDAAPLQRAAGDAEGEPMRGVLLVATMRRRVEGIMAMLTAAGLTPIAATSSTLALALQSPAEDGAMMLRVTHDAVELAWRDGARVGTVRHLATHGPGESGGDAAWATQLAGELRRISMGLPRSNGPAGISIFDGAGLDAPAIDALGERLAMQPNLALAVGPLRLSETASTNGHVVAERRHAAALAVALTAREGAPRSIDFLHSQLAPPPKRMPALYRWGGAAAAVLLILLIALAVDITLTSRRISAAQAAFADIEADVQAATIARDRVRFARGWYEQKPPILECMAAITEAFPQQGTIWAQNVKLDENMTGTITGKAENRNHVLTVLDGIKASSRFSEEFVTFRPADAKTNHVGFTLNFRFIPAAADARPRGKE